MMENGPDAYADIVEPTIRIVRRSLLDVLTKATKAADKTKSLKFG